MTGVVSYNDFAEEVVKLAVDKDVEVFNTKKRGHLGGVINVGSLFANADQIDMQIFLYLPDPDKSGNDLVPVRHDYRILQVSHQNEQDQKNTAPAWVLDEVYAPYGGFITLTNVGARERKVYVNLYRRNCE